MRCVGKGSVTGQLIARWNAIGARFSLVTHLVLQDVWPTPASTLAVVLPQCLLTLVVISRLVVVCRVDPAAVAAVARTWASAAKMARQSRLQQMFMAVDVDGVEKYRCKLCGDSFSKSNAYRHCRAESPKHCPYLFAHDSEEGLHAMEWVPQVWCCRSGASSGRYPPVSRIVDSTG